MPFFLILLALPLIEIALFIVVGGWIGVWGTLALIVLGALCGVLVLRGERDRMAQVVANGMRRIEPAVFLAQGSLTMIGALLLILPGFLTDAVGLVLLLPPVQAMVARRLRGRVASRSVIIEGDYVVNDPDAPQDDRQHRLPSDRDH